MIRALACLLAPMTWVTWGAAGAFAAPLQAPVHARLTVEPATSEIGEPVTWLLTIDHPAAAKVSATTPELDRAWLLLDDQHVVRVPDSADPTVHETRIAWTVAALEPGARALPAILVAVDADGAHTTLASEPAVMEVRPALSPDEDAPRPQRGFRPPPPGAEAAPRWPWLGALLVLAALPLLALWRRRRRSVPVAPPTALERLAALDQRVAAEPGAGRHVVYAASALLRASIDAALGESSASLTDEDWIAKRKDDERLPLGVRSASARLLASTQRVKYALEVPTRFALEELLRDVRQALEALAEARIEPAAPASASAPANVGRAA